MRKGGFILLAVLAVVFALIALARPFSFRSTLTGRVEGPDGKGVDGAFIAALPVGFKPGLDPWQALQGARSDREGEFRLNLRRGAYTLSVTHPELESTGGVPCRASGGRNGAPRLIFRLGPGTRLLEGRLVPENGKAPPDGLVALAPAQGPNGDLNPMEGPIYVAEARNGRYRLGLPPGRYALSTRAQGFGEREASVTLAGSLTRFDLPLAPAPSMPSKAVADWIREHAIGLASPDPVQAPDDLGPLAAMVGSAKVVAVGEACHGTREFTQLAHRLIAFLIERMGFTAIGLEANPADTVALNDYIQQGAGDLDQAELELGFWTGPTREVRDLAVWLRQYNANPAHPAKVSVFGMDPLVATRTPGTGLEGRRAREKAMAGQVRTVLRRMPAGSKIVVWVHNDHAAKCLPEGWAGVEPMGWHLREALGTDYLAVGTAFRRGAFLALDPGRHPRAIATFTVPAHRAATLGAALAAVGKPMLFLDLRALPGQGETAAWFRTPQGAWSIGAEFPGAGHQALLDRVAASRAFDLLFFVERIRPPRRPHACGSR